MAGKFGKIGMATLAKLLVVVALVGITLHVTGLRARPGPTPVVQPAKAAAHLASKTVSVPKPIVGPFVVKRVLDIPGPFRHGDYAWNDEGVPQGPAVITIDLKAQTLSVFRDGYEIGAAVILYGANDKPTPLGTYPIMAKDADHWSSTYDAAMPYSLRLTADGVAIHGSNVAWGAATHGCIGVPTAFAKLMFSQVKVGDKVIITNGKMLDVGGRITSD